MDTTVGCIDPETKRKQFLDGAVFSLNSWRSQFSVNAGEGLNGWNYSPWLLPHSPSSIIWGKLMRFSCLSLLFWVCVPVCHNKYWIHKSVYTRTLSFRMKLIHTEIITG
jgi:hypothetical protein